VVAPTRAPWKAANFHDLSFPGAGDEPRSPGTDSTYYRWVREAQEFALYDRMYAAGMSFEQIEAVVMAAERERREATG
jgi:hypothetical protein